MEYNTFWCLIVPPKCLVFDVQDTKSMCETGGKGYINVVKRLWLRFTRAGETLLLSPSNGLDASFLVNGRIFTANRLSGSIYDLREI